jgi:hypothetical protein
MKHVVFCFIVILSNNIFAVPNKSFHELFHLTPKYEKDENSDIDTMLLRSEPSIKKVNIVNSIKYKTFNPLGEDYDKELKKFDLKNKNYYYLDIMSKEKRGDFFKVSYLGKELWVHEKHFLFKRSVDFIYKNKTYIDLERTTQFYSKIGEKFNSKDLLKKIKHKYPILQSRVIETKWVKNELWFKVILGNVNRVCDTAAYLDESVELWMRPYDKNGNLMFTYSNKNGC